MGYSYEITEEFALLKRGPWAGLRVGMILSQGGAKGKTDLRKFNGLSWLHSGPWPVCGHREDPGQSTEASKDAPFLGMRETLGPGEVHALAEIYNQSGREQCHPDALRNPRSCLFEPLGSDPMGRADAEF